MKKMTLISWLVVLGVSAIAQTPANYPLRWTYDSSGGSFLVEGRSTIIAENGYFFQVTAQVDCRAQHTLQLLLPDDYAQSFDVNGEPHREIFLSFDVKSVQNRAPSQIMSAKQISIFYTNIAKDMSRRSVLRIGLFRVLVDSSLLSVVLDLNNYRHKWRQCREAIP